jgi:hypothetical protein
MRFSQRWDITPCSVNRRFGGTYGLHLQGRKNKVSKKPAWKQVASRIIPARHTLTLSPVPALFRDSLTPVLISYWFARGATGCWRFRSVLRTSQLELRSSLLLPFCFLYKPRISVCLTPAFMLVSCWAFISTLKMEAICSSETSVDTQRITRRYIPEGGTL